MRPMPELEIEMAKVADLVPYARNAKLHPHEQIDQIAASIEEVGFNDPVAVWTNPEGEMEIVEGHGRVLACRKLGIEDVPVIHLDHLTDEQRRFYTHVHNQLTINSDFDFAILDADIEELDFDWEDYGFEPATIEWDFGGSLDEDSYEEPDKVEYRCPQCGHVDSKERFVRA